MVLRENGVGDRLSQDHVQWRTLLLAVLKLRFLISYKNLDLVSVVSF
jgi:hypothetical protein